MEKTTNQETLLCHRCKVPLIAQKTFFKYLGHSFHTDIPTCPKCGIVFISESLAKGRMAQVEQELEDK
jgi:hydrogenase maturation factor HypF (carbamoyltransferase family)